MALDSNQQPPIPAPVVSRAVPPTTNTRGPLMPPFVPGRTTPQPVANGSGNAALPEAAPEPQSPPAAVPDAAPMPWEETAAPAAAAPLLPWEDAAPPAAAAPPLPWEDAAAPAAAPAPPMPWEEPAPPPASRLPAEEDMWPLLTEQGSAEPAWDSGEEIAGGPAEFPLDAFIIPEHAKRLPTGYEAEHDALSERIAARLDQLAQELRTSGLGQLGASPSADELTRLIAGVVAGYLGRGGDV